MVIKEQFGKFDKTNKQGWFLFPFIEKLSWQDTISISYQCDPGIPIFRGDLCFSSSAGNIENLPGSWQSNWPIGLSILKMDVCKNILVVFLPMRTPLVCLHLAPYFYKFEDASAETYILSRRFTHNNELFKMRRKP